MSVEIGLYQHFKGGLYWVMGTAKHSETLEEMVVYVKYHGPGDLGMNEMWVRPASMWSEEAKPGVPRFRKCVDAIK